MGNRLVRLKGANVSVDTCLAECVELLYSGLADLEARHRFFEKLSCAVGSVGSGLERSSPSGEIVAPSRHHENYVVEPDITRTYMKFANLNPFKRIFRGIAAEGQVAIGSDHVDLRTLEGTAYWQGFMRPFDMQYPARIVPHVTPSAITICHFAKTVSAGDFTSAERELIQRIAPHMTNFFKLDHYVDSLLLTRDAAWEALDSLAFGIVLLGLDGKIQFRNARAMEIADARDGLRFACNTITASDPESALTLRRRIEAVAGAVVRHAPPPGDAIAIRRRSTELPYRILVMALCPPGAAPIRACIGVVIHDPLQRADGEMRKLQAAYDLTPAEAEVALAIALGQSLDQCAADTHRNVSTARNLLKRAFSKTGTNRQNELASVILKDALGLPCRMMPTQPDAALV